MREQEMPNMHIGTKAIASPLMVRKSIASPFDESKHPRDDSGEFSSSGGKSDRVTQAADAIESLKGHRDIGHIRAKLDEAMQGLSKNEVFDVITKLGFSPIKADSKTRMLEKLRGNLEGLSVSMVRNDLIRKLSINSPLFVRKSTGWTRQTGEHGGIYWQSTTNPDDKRYQPNDPGGEGGPAKPDAAPTDKISGYADQLKAKFGDNDLSELDKMKERVAGDPAKLAAIEQVRAKLAPAKAEEKPAEQPKAISSPLKIDASDPVSSAHAQLDSLYKAATSDPDILEKVQAFKPELAKLTKPQLTDVAKRFNIKYFPPNKGQAIDAIIRRIEDRRSFHERSTVTPIDSTSTYTAPKNMMIPSPLPRPAATPMEDAPEVAPTKPLPKPTDPTAIDALAKVQSIYDAVISDPSAYSKADMLTGDLGKLSMPQIKQVANGFGMHYVPPTKGDAIQRIISKIRERKDFHDRAHVKLESKSITTPLRVVKGLAGARSKAIASPMGFTGIDSHGHKWVAGKQVAIGKDEPAQPRQAAQQDDPNSRSRQVLDAYLKEKQSKAATKSLSENRKRGGEEIDLNEQEEAALDRAWASLEKKTGSATKSLKDDTDLGDPQERIEAIAEIVGGIFGDQALEMLGDGVRKSPFRESDHPRGKGGRFIPKGSAEAHATAKEAIKQTLKTKTPETAKKLMDHLSILSVKQLHELKKEYGLSASGPNKAALVAKIAERLGKGRVEPREAMTMDSPGFAKMLTDEALKLKDMAGRSAEDIGPGQRHKVFISDLYDAVKGKVGNPPLGDFKKRLGKMLQTGEVELSRADLVGGGGYENDADRRKLSETYHPARKPDPFASGTDADAHYFTVDPKAAAKDDAPKIPSYIDWAKGEREGNKRIRSPLGQSVKIPPTTLDTGEPSGKIPSESKPQPKGDGKMSWEQTGKTQSKVDTQEKIYRGGEMIPNPHFGKERETITRAEALKLAEHPDVPAGPQAKMRVDNYFADTNPGDSMWADELRERLAKPPKGQRPSIGNTHTMLSNGNDR